MPSTSTLLPREHGAWVQLALPLVGALAAGRPGPAAWTLVAAVVLAFLAHEPLLVLLGHRGARARDAEGPRARRRFALLATAAVATALVAAALVDGPSRIAALAFIIPSALVVPLMLRRGERSTAFEVGVSIALAGAAPMVALAAGVAPRVAALHGLLWATTFAAETLAARGVLAMSSKRARSRRLLALATAVAAVALGAAATAVALDLAGPALMWAAVPVLPLCALVWWRPPPAKRLAPVGVAMALAGGLSLAALLALPL